MPGLSAHPTYIYPRLQLSSSKMTSPTTDNTAMTIRGNVSEHLKTDIYETMIGLVFEPTFAWDVGSKLQLTDVDELEVSESTTSSGSQRRKTTARVIAIPMRFVIE